MRPPTLSETLRLLTVEEVAQLLQIPAKSIYSQRHRGAMPGSLGIRVGRFIRFRPDTLERWLSSQDSSINDLRSDVRASHTMNGDDETVTR